jgi:hypothetical protein
MKGTLMKTDQGWMVNYDYSINKNDWETLPLHPDFIEMMDTCFTSKFTNDIEFEIVTEWENGEVGVNGLTYAKLIHHPVNTNKMIDHVPDVGKMVEDDYLPTADEFYIQLGFMPNNHQLGYDIKTAMDEFAKLHVQKAKETLYTEEQVRDAIDMARREIITDAYGDLEVEYLLEKEQIIQSLKQPKQ